MGLERLLNDDRGGMAGTWLAGQSKRSEPQYSPGQVSDRFIIRERYAVSFVPPGVLDAVDRPFPVSKS